MVCFEQVLLSVWDKEAEVKPQQLFLMLTTQSGLTAYAVAKARKEGGFALTVTAALLEKQIGRQVKREQGRVRDEVRGRNGDTAQQSCRNRFLVAENVIWHFRVSL